MTFILILHNEYSFAHLDHGLLQLYPWFAPDGIKLPSSLPESSDSSKKQKITDPDHEDASVVDEVDEDGDDDEAVQEQKRLQHLRQQAEDRLTEAVAKEVRI